MLYWMRELLGWVLMLIGLAFFWGCLTFVNSRQVVEASILAGVGVFVFRGGIHLMKVAVAARIYLESKDDTKTV